DLKRAEIDAFLTTQLPRQVDGAFAIASKGERTTLKLEVQELAERIRREIADDAISPAGEANPSYAKVKLVEMYQAKKRDIDRITTSEADRNDVFSHLFAFFSRYYDAGDFIPKRFYGSREAYGLP